MSSTELALPESAQNSQIQASAVNEELSAPAAAGIISLPKLGYYSHSLPNKDQGIQSEFNFSLESGVPLRIILAELNRLNVTNGYAPVLSESLLSDKRLEYAPEAEKTIIMYQLSRGYFPDRSEGKSETICALIEPAPLEIAATFLALYTNEFNSGSAEDNFSNSYFLRSTVFLTNQGALTWSPEGLTETKEIYGPYSAMLCMPKNSVLKNIDPELS